MHKTCLLHWRHCIYRVTMIYRYLWTFWKILPLEENPWNTWSLRHCSRGFRTWKREKHQKPWICLVKLDGFRLTLLETWHHQIQTSAGSIKPFSYREVRSLTASQLHKKNLTFLLRSPCFCYWKEPFQIVSHLFPQWFTTIQPPGLECRTEISSMDQGSCQRYGARCLSLCRFPEVQHCHIFMDEDYLALVA